MKHALSMIFLFKQHGQVAFSVVYPNKKAAKKAQEFYKDEISKGLKKDENFFIHSIDAPDKVQSDWDSLLIIPKNLISVSFQIIKMKDSKVEDNPEYYQVIHDGAHYLRPFGQFENPYVDAVHEDLAD